MVSLKVQSSHTGKLIDTRSRRLTETSSLVREQASDGGRNGATSRGACGNERAGDVRSGEGLTRRKTVFRIVETEEGDCGWGKTARGEIVQISDVNSFDLRWL